MGKDIVILALWLTAQTVLSLTSHQCQVEIGHPIGSYITTIVQHHPTLALNTNNGYLTNPHRLHKLDLPSRSSTLIKLLLLLIGGDIEINPGPIQWPAKSDFAGVFPCGTCELRVDWSDIAVECDGCNVWHHKSCVSMSTSHYDNINANDASWNCHRCHSVNNSSVLYHAYNLNVSNSFDPIAGIPGDDSVFHKSINEPCSPGSFDPLTHSSPNSINLTNSSASKSKHAVSSAGLSGKTSGTLSCSSAEMNIHTANENNLRIVVANVNSISGKRAEMIHLCDSVKPDIILVSETKLEKSVKHSEFLPSAYTGHIRHDHTKHGGGVMIIHRKDLVIDEIELVDPKTPHHDHVVWAKLTVRNTSPIYIGSYYRSNSRNDKETIPGLISSLDHIASLTKNNPKATVIVGGDFNVRDIDWENQTVPEGAEHKPLCEAVVQVLQHHHLDQLQKTPTRQDSLLDLYCTNKPGLVKSIHNIPGFTVNDHEFLVIDSWFTPEKLKKPPRKFYKWSKADWLRMRVESHLWADKLIEDCKHQTYSVQDLYTKFCTHIKDMLNKHVPQGLTRTRSDVPWLTRDLKRMCRKKRRFYNRAKKTGQTRHWSIYKECADKVKKDLRKAHWQHINNILLAAENDKNPKPFWNYIKSQNQDSTGVAPLKSNNQLYSGAYDRASILSKQFKSVFTKDNAESKNTAPYGPNYPCMSEFTITEFGVQKLLSAINPSKAGGPDEVPCRVLKELADELAPVLTHIFQQSIKSGEVPAEWKMQWVTPIYKKGPKCEAANYRPVSLTCVTSKLLEHIICTQIRGHLDKHGILSPFQHGFRARHSCETQLAVTFHDLADLNDQMHQIDIAILDFSKAFDVVPHTRLLNKLQFYGISSEVCNWIREFLSGRKQRIMVDGVFSQEESVDSGVPQGTVLGPLLFLLFINDITNGLSTGTRIRLFADDCLVYRPIRSIQDQLTLQSDLSSLEGWSNTWGMFFNPSKCNIISTRPKSKNHLHHFYTLYGHILKEVDTAKYLGVLLASSLSWSPHIDAVANRANQKLGFIQRNLRDSPRQSKCMGPSQQKRL